MKIQVLSDLHLETETFDPQPAPGAELLVLAGDIDSRWTALERFRGWPLPVIFGFGITTDMPGLARSSQSLMPFGLPLRTSSTIVEV